MNIKKITHIHIEANNFRIYIVKNEIFLHMYIYYVHNTYTIIYIISSKSIIIHVIIQWMSVWYERELVHVEYRRNLFDLAPPRRGGASGKIISFRELRDKECFIISPDISLAECNTGFSRVYHELRNGLISTLREYQF